MESERYLNATTTLDDQIRNRSHNNGKSSILYRNRNVGFNGMEAKCALQLLLFSIVTFWNMRISFWKL